MLPKYTLSHNKKTGEWPLRNDKTNKLVTIFEKKEDALQRNVLRNILGDNGGSVKIQKMNHRFQEERTYPKGKDPRSSKG